MQSAYTYTSSQLSRGGPRVRARVLESVSDSVARPPLTRHRTLIIAGEARKVAAGSERRGGRRLVEKGSRSRSRPPAAPATARRVACRAGFFQNIFGKGHGEAAEEEMSTWSGEWECSFPEDLVEGTFLEGRELQLGYKASRDGFGAMDFHKKCDFKGPCFVFATTKEGLRCGGFNPVGFMSTDDYKDNFNAFLFYLPDKKSDEFVVLEKVGGPEAAIFDFGRGGPQWGTDALVIAPPLSPVMGGFAGPESESALTAGDMRTAKSRLGLSYAVRPDGAKSLFGKAAETTLVDVEVYYSPEIAKLY